MNKKNPIIYNIGSPEIQKLCLMDMRLAAVIQSYGDLEYSLHEDEYIFFIETIVGQMLSNKAADAISNRLHKLCGGNISINSIYSINDEEMRKIGISRQKTSYIKDFTLMVRDDPSFFAEFKDLSDSDIIHHLTKIRGIGPWSAKMYLIFVLNRLDVLPYEDGAFMQVYKWLYPNDDYSASAVKIQCNNWKPYSSIASRYLYRALDSGMIQSEEIREKPYSLDI